MPYASNRIYCDADSHIMETVDWVAKHADPGIRAKIPPLNLSKSGTKSYDFIHEAVETQKRRASEGVVPSNVVKGVKGWNAPGAFDATERRRALDDLGFSRQLVFSTFSGAQYLEHAD